MKVTENEQTDENSDWKQFYSYQTLAYNDFSCFINLMTRKFAPSTKCQNSIVINYND